MNLAEYEKLLSVSRKNYSFLKIDPKASSKAKSYNTRGKKVCFLRHDIDYDPENALRIARTEAEMGIISTYTVLLTGEFYNPFEPNNRRLLNEISDLGHHLGLHFDPTVHDIQDEEDLDRSIIKEKMALEDLLSTKVDMFSFHNTTDFSMSCRKKIYGKCQNAYSKFFHKEVEYTSDSNGYWRFRDWETFLSEEHPIIQILTHPIWWQPNNHLPPLETITKFMLKKYRNQMDSYNKLFINQIDRENVSYLSSHLKKQNKLNNKDLLNNYVTDKDLVNYLMNEKEDKEVLGRIIEEYVNR